jgi:predicted pyridoxine 5'-phosphate oxidase superfamily flavin-nucleotide-binding protein
MALTKIYSNRSFVEWPQIVACTSNDATFAVDMDVKVFLQRYDLFFHAVFNPQHFHFELILENQKNTIQEMMTKLKF